MASFRYAQFCPVARAAEIVGERWTLLIVRELLLGPRRFSDLSAPLSGISPSVLAGRLASLEERGVVARRTLPPPAAATVYELTPRGERLEPMLLELGRWGIELLDARQADDYFDPAWVELALRMLCRVTPTPERRFCVTVPLRVGELRLAVVGGESGASVSHEIAESDASIHAESFVVMGMATGELDPEDAIRSGALRASGNVEALRDFPALFQKPTPDTTGD